MPTTGTVGFGAPPKGFWPKLRFRLHELLWGFFLFEFWHELRQQRHKYEDAMNVVIMGELLGIPLMNSVVTLRLLPYLLGDLPEWRRRALTEREVLDASPDIH